MKLLPVSKTYHGRQVLNAGEMELSENTIYVLVGANGSGKSTFCRIHAGLLAPDVKRVPSDRNLKIAYLPQRPYAFRMSLEKNLRILSNDKEREDRLIRQLHLENIRKTDASKLSGGETARMALARVLMNPSDILILDEPTAAMDMESIALSEQAIRDYRRETGATVLLVTHNVQQARRMGDEVLFFHEGIILEKGSCQEHLEHPETQEMRRFLDFYG